MMMKWLISQNYVDPYIVIPIAYAHIHNWYSTGSCASLISAHCALFASYQENIRNSLINKLHEYWITDNISYKEVNNRIYTLSDNSSGGFDMYHPLPL